ncbi:MAG: hypothetical protein EPO68_03510 [Planctomycetota bacterium]|nr:MAG: hypothetical protein EPO68_03510 [Planctomycetota bacterium]
MPLAHAALALAPLLALQSPAEPVAPARPRLVVFVVVDQMIPAQLERLRPLLGGGLGRFVAHGTWYRQTWIDYAVTVTAPGHATLSTGVHPSRHGIVSNEKPKADESGLEATVSEVGALRVQGLADWVREFAPGSKSFSASVKDRSAILLAGQHPDVAVCWDGGNGGFEPAQPGVKDLPAWIAAWNSGWIERAAPGGKPWTWANEIPGDPLALGCQPDDQVGEAPWFAGGITFPHVGPSAPEAGKRASRLASFTVLSPLGDAFCVDLARRAVDELALGADAVPDVLCVSLSGCDAVGHALGPYSQEVTDLLLRADRELAKLFADLDAKVGAERWIAALSADHGVPDLPERRRARLEGGERIASSVLKQAAQAVDALLVEEGLAGAALSFDVRGLYLKRSKLKDARDPVALRAKLRDLLVAQLPCARAFTSDELAAALAAEAMSAESRPSAQAPADAKPAALDTWLVLAAHSFDAERSPDVSIQYPPGSLVALAAGTTHGSPNDYDRRVPLAFLGPGFAAREDWRSVRTVDALPTLLHAAGFTPPAGLDGRSLFDDRAH